MHRRQARTRGRWSPSDPYCPLRDTRCGRFADLVRCVDRGRCRSGQRREQATRTSICHRMITTSTGDDANPAGHSHYPPATGVSASQRGERFRRRHGLTSSCLQRVTWAVRIRLVRFGSGELATSRVRSVRPHRGGHEPMVTSLAEGSTLDDIDRCLENAERGRGHRPEWRQHVHRPGRRGRPDVFYAGVGGQVRGRGALLRRRGDRGPRRVRRRRPGST